MNDLVIYEEVVKAAKKLLRAEKDVTKKSDSYRGMSFEAHSVKARAGASDRLTEACFSRDKAIDYMHKVLVDAFLVQPKSRDSYDKRIITHSHGFGHSYSFNYTPPIPECFK